MEIYKEFVFDAAHSLPNVPEGHKCSRIHGHTFTVKIFVKGPVDKHFGWVVDFGDIKKSFKPLFEMLDHHYINEIEGLENPTSENLSIWIWNKMKNQIPGLHKIIVQETPTCGAIYRGESE